MSRNTHAYRRYGFSAAFPFTTDGNGVVRLGISCNGITSVTIEQQGFGTAITFPQSSEFTSLYDKYKILSFYVQLIPRFDSEDYSAGTGFLPQIFWVQDSDDGNSPASLDAIMERPNPKHRMLNHPVYLKRSFPMVAPPVYQPGATWAYSNERGPYIDMAYPSVPHYGIKGAIVGAADTAYRFDVRICVNFIGKGVM